MLFFARINLTTPLRGERYVEISVILYRCYSLSFLSCLPILTKQYIMLQGKKVSDFNSG